MRRRPEDLNGPHIVDPRESVFRPEGKTLLLNGVGNRGSTLAAQFMQILNSSHGSGTEVFAASFPRIGSGTLDRINHAIGRSWNPLQRRPTVFTDTQGMLETGKKSDHNLHTALHFVSYDGDNVDTIRETLARYKEGLPDIFHLAIVYKPRDPIGRRDFEQGIQAYPLEDFLMPMILLDEEKATTLDNNSENRTKWLKSERAFLFGIAGLISGPRLFPDVNPNPYRKVLEAIAQNGKYISVGIGSEEVPVIRQLRGLRKLVLAQDLSRDVERAISRSLKNDATISAGLRDENAQSDIIVVQVPLNPKDPFWHDPLFLPSIERGMPELLADADEQIAKADLVLVYSTSIALERSDKEAAAMIATHLFPGKPGLDKPQKASGRPRSGKAR